MLDTDTKRRIDTARDILVGKVPDPKSQVEQITIALIYKFMDDMDAESEEFGGKRKFFAKEFARYGWAKLMRSGLGGHETLALYAEAITKMPENPGIPLLFRDIFKNAYLPYRDPETLRAFLKIIDEFSYDHSEKLGDAYEYLLSILGSQGAAGQFRTPRHIIDFMVEVLDPKKNETVLDPACGTAGFLISSYKHILRAHDPSDRSDRSHQVKPLTPDEKGRLAQNFKGYDIDPLMARLAKANLYLHGFTDPHIFEYDSLTSQERWSDYADVILANPPFMSPKGGIKPHNRFTVQSKRSEVLFVDYMAEHLTPNGRAGIIVPEGIIFQSQTAYKQLRKMLVEEYLVAVVSLPAGVFNPYSGVKTSILILDKSLAKRTNAIAFLKVENDGYGLGAQRREIEKNDLPAAATALKSWLKSPTCPSSDPSNPADLADSPHWLLVPKAKIAANGEFNLSGERYREGGRRSSEYPHVELGEVVEILDSRRRPITKHDRKPGPYPYYGATGILDYVEGYLFDEPLVLVGEDGAKWGSGENSAFPAEGKVWVNNHAHVLRPKRDLLLDRFLIEILNEADLLQYVTGVTVPKLNQEKLRSILIPLPPLEVQKEIVAEIEGYQKVINGAHAVLNNYRPHIPIAPEWPVVTFEEAPFEIIDGDRGVNYPKKGDFSLTGYCVFLNTKNVRSDGFCFGEIEFISKESDEALRKGKLRRGDVVLTTRGTIGNTGFYDSTVPYEHMRINSGMLIFRPDPKVLLGDYLFHFFQSQNFIKQRDSIVSGSAQPQLPIRSLNGAIIPLPPLATQQAIVAEIEAEQALVAANRELIARFEKKIQATLGRVWGTEED